AIGLALSPAHGDHVAARDHHRSTNRGLVRRQHLEKGRLSAAATADDGQTLSDSEVELDAAQRHHDLVTRAVHVSEVPHVEQPLSGMRLRLGLSGHRSHGSGSGLPLAGTRRAIAPTTSVQAAKPARRAPAASAASTEVAVAPGPGWVAAATRTPRRPPGRRLDQVTACCSTARLRATWDPGRPCAKRPLYSTSRRALIHRKWSAKAIWASTSAPRIPARSPT